MNLLDSILCAAEADEYKNLFEKYGIDAHTLKTLEPEDLKILGIENEEMRLKILDHAKHLQIPEERPVPVVIDEAFIQHVLTQMSAHLTNHLAALSIAVNHKDVIVTNIKTSAATKCLAGCLDSLQLQIEQSRTKFVPNHRMKNKRKYVFLLSIFTGATLYLTYSYFKIK